MSVEKDFVHQLVELNVSLTNTLAAKKDGFFVETISNVNHKQVTSKSR